MIRNTVINVNNYFYPLGNTPAVSLTQDLPPQSSADILLLGCGDARNILFSCFADPDRHFDITCCDIQPAVIARNLLLYSFLFDGPEFRRIDQIWKIYYHWKIDSKSLKFLERQVEKLLSISENISQWHASDYGNAFRFCNDRTLRQVRQFWLECSSSGLSALQKSHKQKTFQDGIEKAQGLRKKMVGGTGVKTDLAGGRSAAPTGFLAVQDFSTVAARWWEEGTTSFRQSNQKSKHLNPAFFASRDQSLIIHYGTDPLLGFHLATAYVPLLDDTSLYVEKSEASTAEHLVACAHEHFRTWAIAFRNTISQGSTLRFCVADALAFSLTLKTAKLQDGKFTANLSCDSWTSEPLILDEDEYGSQGDAPRLFDIVDTSNLIDHLGPLNLLPACITLLKNTNSSTAYTESLVQNDVNERQRVAGLLGGDICTIALLLGISAVEMWTNATNSPEDESMLEPINNRMVTGEAKSATQVRSRLRWKQLRSSEDQKADTSIIISPSDLAPILVKLYDHMFQHEDLRSMMANMDLKTMSKGASPFYNRLSFVMLLKVIQKRVVTDWQECLDNMRSQIFSRLSGLSAGALFAQELLLHMHMLGVVTNQLPTFNLSTSQQSKMAPFFSKWPHVPAQVCITIRVPRANLRLFTQNPLSTGTPTVRCDIEGTDAKSHRPWCNTFTSIQLAFGKARLSHENGVPKLQITDDGSAWFGSSDMYASTIIPTWMILQADEIVPVVNCGLMSTRQSTYAFVKDLGLKMNFFSTKITSEAVVVSQCMPSMSSLPRLCDEGLNPLQNLSRTITANLSSAGILSTLVIRTTFTSNVAISQLRNRSVPVHVDFQDSFTGFLIIGDTVRLLMEFPLPIDPTRRKVRIARTSSYVEVEAPLWNPLTETSSVLMFPIAPSTNFSERPFAPVPLTATRIRLDQFPVINTSDKTGLEWLVTHASLMFSDRERNSRDTTLTAQSPPTTKADSRLEMKDTIFSMLMTYTGLQGRTSKIFAFVKDDNGVNIIFLPSCLRLDLVNRTVVLDVAAIPLTNQMSTDTKVTSFYESLTDLDVMQITVSDEELRCWKSMMPALAERCRAWKHKTTCEYATQKEIPITKGLDDGNTPLCSCGIGKFPVFYLKDPKLKNLNYVLKKHATRIAISPVFALPYVEDCFLTNPVTVETLMNSFAVEQGCAHCGSQKRRTTVTGEEKLLVCARCMKKRYCSVECQKADWKDHKQVCGRS